MLKHSEIERGYAEIERAAIAGERCPTNRSGENRAGTLRSGITRALTSEGRIRVEVYPHNWRVIEILKGPHAGKRTAPPPNRKWRPYLVLPAPRGAAA